MRITIGRVHATVLLLALVGVVSASEVRRKPPQHNQAQAQYQAQKQAQKQAQLQLQLQKAQATAKAAAAAKASAGAAAKAKSGDSSSSLATGSVSYDAAAIAPNPSAPPPSAQCRYGWSITGAVVEFGAGITGSDWDEICGLWLAAQQTTGDAKVEAASAAFCLTMKKAKVMSPTCAMWDQGQGELRVTMSENRAAISFGGVGGTSGVVISGPDQ